MRNVMVAILALSAATVATVAGSPFSFSHRAGGTSAEGVLFGVGTTVAATSASASSASS